MPNWCANNLSVEGPKAEIKAFEQFMQTEQSKFDFNAILPQPKELQGIHSGTITIDGKEFRVWRVIDGKKIGITPEEELELISLCGATNWYDWNRENWGTKWNTAADNVEVNMYPDTHINYMFDSAWLPPIPVIQALAEKFPNLSFTLEFEEPGCSFWGEMEWQNGELVHQQEGEMGVRRRS